MDKLKKKQDSQIALREQFIKENTISNSIKKYSNVSNALTAYSCDSIELAMIRKELGSEYQLKYIMMWLVDLNEFINAKFKMSADQIKGTAQLIADTFYYFKISEFYFALKCIKKGIYGKLYESLDGMKIMDWLSQYDQQRTENLPTVQSIQDLDHDAFMAQFYAVNEEGRIIRKIQKDKPKKNVYAETVEKTNKKKIEKDITYLKKEQEFKDFQENYNKKNGK